MTAETPDKSDKAALRQWRRAFGIALTGVFAGVPWQIERVQPVFNIEVRSA
ncbi:hypothetical protein Thiowin_04125 [Thiorhodovibrio winogradskyi]|uniref:Uncharacterized protein n=1 Tax=Thiorhodovibrio winogradskyi TaxID=77007 RepID=A0ABZ0SGW2_9GAMM|nr:hypothetical protein [Thiorhodovibrio winogradskyi]